MASLSIGIFDSLAPDERQAVVRGMTRRRYARRETVFHEGDPGDSLHVIVKGHVSLRVTTPRGDSAVLRVLGPGDIFGQFALVAPGPRSATVTALDTTETMTLGREDFKRLRGEHPGLDSVLLESAIREIRRLSTALLDALYLPAHARLLRRLLEVASLYTNGSDEPVVVPLGQDDLAGLAGLARPTANRILTEAQAAGTIRISRGRIEILDADALARRAR